MFFPCAQILLILTVCGSAEVRYERHRRRILVLNGHPLVIGGGGQIWKMGPKQRRHFAARNGNDWPRVRKNWANRQQFAKRPKGRQRMPVPNNRNRRARPMASPLPIPPKRAARSHQNPSHPVVPHSRTGSKRQEGHHHHRSREAPHQSEATHLTSRSSSRSSSSEISSDESTSGGDTDIEPEQEEGGDPFFRSHPNGRTSRMAGPVMGSRSRSVSFRKHSKFRPVSTSAENSRNASCQRPSPTKGDEMPHFRGSIFPRLSTNGEEYVYRVFVSLRKIIVEREQELLDLGTTGGVVEAKWTDLDRAKFEMNLAPLVDGSGSEESSSGGGEEESPAPLAVHVAVNRRTSFGVSEWRHFVVDQVDPSRSHVFDFNAATVTQFPSSRQILDRLHTNSGGRFRTETIFEGMNANRETPKSVEITSSKRGPSIVQRKKKSFEWNESQNYSLSTQKSMEEVHRVVIRRKSFVANRGQSMDLRRDQVV